MPHLDRDQLSFTSASFLRPESLSPGSLPWLLAYYWSELFSGAHFDDWHGNGPRGRNAWPARILMVGMLLRWSETGLSRRAAARQFPNDLRWLAAAGLDAGAETPSETTWRRFERYLDEEIDGKRRLARILEHLAQRSVALGVIHEPTWVMDGTPMKCYGALHGTVRLLGDGCQILAKKWARLRKESLASVSRRLKIVWLKAKSIKGAFRVNWKNKLSKNEVVTTLVKGVHALTSEVMSGILDVPLVWREALLQECRNLLKVITDDLEKDGEGILSIVWKKTPGRLVSITDPEARSSRKTKSKPYKGFKLHVLGDIKSGIIVSLDVTSADVGEGTAALGLLGSAKSAIDSIDEVLGDTAYGGIGLELEAQKLFGIGVIAPPIPVGKKDGQKLGVADFDIDIKAMTVRCPNGDIADIRTTKTRLVASWKGCAGCPFEESCVSYSRKNKVLYMHLQYGELLEKRARWQSPEVQAKYRRRTEGERLVNQMTRHGARAARQFGLRGARLQCELVAMRSNLSIIARALVLESSPQQLAA